MRPNIYTATMHPPSGDSWLEQARHHDARLGMITTAIGIVGLLEPGALLAFPAGLLVASSLDGAQATAEALRDASKEAMIGVIFGVDIARDGSWGPLEGPPDSYLFASQVGVRLLWPAKVVRPGRRTEDAEPVEPRMVTMAGRRIAVAAGAEIFHSTLRRQLAAVSPDLILLPTHVGPNERWTGALQLLNRVAPTVLTGECRQPAATAPPPLWAQSPEGWSGQVVSRQPGMTLQVHKPERARSAVAFDELGLAATG